MDWLTALVAADVCRGKASSVLPGRDVTVQMSVEG
jgi:hypothetical protein